MHQSSITRLLPILFTFFLFSNTICAAAPTGIWTIIDDKTHEKRAKIQLKVNKNNVLTGTLIQTFPKPGDTGFCQNCSGRFKNKPVKGLEILWGLKEQEDGSWGGGKILDAKTGKIYRLKMIQKGDKLYVRGYLGISMIGRTQVWTRK